MTTCFRGAGIPGSWAHILPRPNLDDSGPVQSKLLQLWTGGTTDVEVITDKTNTASSGVVTVPKKTCKWKISLNISWHCSSTQPSSLWATSFQQHQCSREFIKKILVISTNQYWLFGQRWVANRVIWCKSQTFWTAKPATPTISLMGRQHTF